VSTRDVLRNLLKQPSEQPRMLRHIEHAIPLLWRKSCQPGGLTKNLDEQTIVRCNGKARHPKWSGGSQANHLVKDIVQITVLQRPTFCSADEFDQCPVSSWHIVVVERVSSELHQRVGFGNPFQRCDCTGLVPRKDNPPWKRTLMA